MYYPRAALIHTLNIDREDASGRPGLWAVDIFVDGKLKESRKFNIEPGPTAIRSPHSAQDRRSGRW